MPKPIIKPSKPQPPQGEGYCQAVGVLKGLIKKRKGRGKESILTLLYRGREFLVNPVNSKFTPQSRFFTENYLHYLVYPSPMNYKAYDLLKRDYGRERGVALQKVRGGLLYLISQDPWAKKFVEANTPELLEEGVLTHLFDYEEGVDKGKRKSQAASSVFRLLQGCLFNTNKEISQLGVEAAQETVTLLNYCLSEQLFHPDTHNPSFHFLMERINQKYAAKDQGTPTQKITFNTMEFQIVGFSAEGYEELEDGRFNLSGLWKVRERTPNKAFFNWYVNNGTPKPKNLIQEDIKKRTRTLNIFLGNAQANLGFEEFPAKGTCQFVPRFNSFTLEGRLRQYETINPPLKSSCIKRSRGSFGKPKEEEADGLIAVETKQVIQKPEK